MLYLIWQCRAVTTKHSLYTVCGCQIQLDFPTPYRDRSSCSQLNHSHKISVANSSKPRVYFNNVYLVGIGNFSWSPITKDWGHCCWEKAVGGIDNSEFDRNGAWDVMIWKRLLYSWAVVRGIHHGHMGSSHSDNRQVMHIFGVSCCKP